MQAVVPARRSRRGAAGLIAVQFEPESSLFSSDPKDPSTSFTRAAPAERTVCDSKVRQLAVDITVRDLSQEDPKWSKFWVWM